MRHAILFLLLFDAAARAEDPVPNRPRVPGKLKLTLRERKAEKPGGPVRAVERDAEWDVHETAVIVCDMWDDHFCKSAAQRVADMAPRMNRVLTATRNHGVQIIHAPSDTIYLYAGTPHRLRLQQAKAAQPPVKIEAWCHLDPKREPELPVDVSKCACDDPVVGPYVRRYSRQHPALDITGYDGVSDNGPEIYNFFRQEGIKNVVLMGVHTNMCVLGRPFGIRQLVKLGFNVALCRDLTDAMYDPRQPPFVSHTRGTEMVVEHIEQYWCPSIRSRDLTRVVPGSAGPVPRKSSAHEFPRHPPLGPREAAASFQTRDGFRMELLAAEPLLASPVAAAYDEDGRLWVVEMRDYPYTDPKNDKAFADSTADLPLGRVRVLTDRDGDGIFDHARVFADNLSWPTGIALWKGGAFVAATPDLLYLRDTDGDGRADVRERVFSGFRKFNVQAVINNLAWGLDHRIYAAGGSNGGKIVAAAEPGAAPVAFGAADFRFDPRRPRFEVLPGGARFGHAFDDWGNRFLCNIRNPVLHVVLPGPYAGRNPHVPLRRALHDAAAAGDTLPVFRASPPEPWRAVRAARWAAEGQAMPRSELVADGFFTSACGVTVYRGAAYPERYRGNVFLSDVAGNLVHRETLAPVGVTFAARRADVGAEFVASTDTWFRPVNFLNAPDGTLHVLDMYRETIEHPWSIPDDIKAKLDLLSGREHGRLWRLAPPDFRAPQPPRLGGAATVALVAHLENPNAWWRETAQRLLFERRDPAAVEPLRTLLHQSKSPLARLHALWSLDGLGALAPDDLTRALADPSAGVRENALRVAEPRLTKDALLVDRVLPLVRDPEVRVRFQTALALGEVAETRATAALAEVGRRDAADEWVRAAVLSAAGERSGRLLRLLVADSAFAGDPSSRVLLRSLAHGVGARQDRAELDDVFDLLSASAPAAWQGEVLAGLGEGLRGRGAALAPLLVGSRAPLAERLRRLLADARAVALDAGAVVGRREQSVELLALGSLDDNAESLTGLLDARHPAPVQLAAVRVLSSFNAPRIPEILLGAWASASPPVRTEMVEALLARPQRAVALVDALEKRRLGLGDVPLTRRSVLLRHADVAVRGRAAALFTGSTPGPRQEILARYRTALELPGEPARGREVFRTTCINCHKLGGEGHDVGPSLETIRHHPPAQLLANILDPNREVSPNYLEYLATTRDGRLVSGLITAETAAAVTLRRAGGVEETVTRRNLEELHCTNRSLMPEGLETQVTPQGMADLLAFLRPRAAGE